MKALAKHLESDQRAPGLPGTIYFADRGTVLDAPIEVVWDFIEKDEEFHPKAHRATLRNFESKELSEVTTLIHCEVRRGGRWRKWVGRQTAIRPALRVNELLEGPYAGSKMVWLYTPRGAKTAVDVLCYMRSSDLTPEQVKHEWLSTLATAHAEDVPWLRRFAERHSPLRTLRP